MTETEIVNLSLGNNNCTRIEFSCNTTVYVVISNPSKERDATCSTVVTRNSCYDIENCCSYHQIEPFLRVCWNNESTCSLYFANIKEGLNNTRLDLYTEDITQCTDGLRRNSYNTRHYFKSYELKGICTDDNNIIIMIVL